MSKHERISQFAAEFAGAGVDARYAGYFILFNRQQFYEAHDVLEDLWLEDRHGPNGNFYKGLIQLAGAFVHWQKRRAQPAQAVFTLAHNNLSRYPGTHEKVNLIAVLELIEHWRQRLETAHAAGPAIGECPPPRIELMD